MLYVQVKSTNQSGYNNDLSIWIGYDKPRLVNEEINMIQADGDELRSILQQFTNIPYPVQARVVKWYGEMATFIYHNLKL